LGGTYGAASTPEENFLKEMSEECKHDMLFLVGGEPEQRQINFTSPNTGMHFTPLNKSLYKSTDMRKCGSHCTHLNHSLAGLCTDWVMFTRWSCAATTTDGGSNLFRDATCHTYNTHAEITTILGILCEML